MADPLAINQERSLPSFVRKYSEAAPLLRRMPSEVVGPVVQLDLDRVRRGQMPLSAIDTILALRASQSRQSSIPDKDKNIFEKIRDDVKGLVTAIPRLPGALIEEVKSLPEALPEASEALGRGDIPGIFEAPGFRMLPGAYVISEGPDAFVEHPVFATLDVAPAIKFGVKSLPAPWRNAATSRIGSFADRFGLGPVSRQTARTMAQANRRLEQMFIEHTKKVADIQNKSGLSDAQMSSLTKIATRGDPQEMARLPIASQQVVAKVNALTEDFMQRGIDRGLLERFDDETYPALQARRLARIRANYWKQVEKGSIKGQERALKTFDVVNKATPPARFRALLGDQFQKRMETLARSRNPTANAAAWGSIQQLIGERLYDAIPNVTTKDLAKLAQEVTPNWVAMKDLGFDPILLPSVGPADIGQMRFPTTFAENLVSPKNARARTWQMQPGIENFSVGLNQLGLEYLQREMTEHVITQWSKFGKTQAELYNEFLPAARKWNAPGLEDNIPAKLEALISREYTAWDPSSIAPWRRPKVGTGVEPENVIYLPKAMERTIRKLYPHDRSQLARLWDTAMGVFRVGVLPLSPRWHIYNIMGGAVLLQARSGPSIWKYLPDAIKMVKDGTLPIEISRGMGTVPREARAWTWMSGQEIAKFTSDNKLFSTLRPVARAGGKVIQKSFDVGEWMDQAYRAMAYMYQRDKSLVKGMSKADAEEAGMRLANKVLQDWDDMVPVERQVLRSIFPFYGWMKHIIQYTFSYPWDHPFRASVVANFARNEIEDWDTGLPTDFHNYFFFGQPDALGNQQAINLRGANPFSDVANYFTLAGFVSQLNPIAGGVMEAMGINPVSGSPDLYPNMVYNPDTGRLQAATKNPLMTVGMSFVPQTGALLSVLGLDPTDLKMLKLNNPGAYNARLWSSVGVPFIPRELNERLEIARAETIKHQALQQVLSDAIRTGDWGEARKYPTLRPILEVVARLQEQDQIEQYRLQPQGQGAFDPAEALRLIQGG